MRIISERQLYHDGKTRPAGEPFDSSEAEGAELVTRKVARPYESPHVVYETKPKRFEQPMRQPKSSNPLVTCVCPTTRKRRDWLRQAIRYFQFQTFGTGELELLIAAESGDLDLSVIPADPRIRVVLYETAHRIPLGAKRNFACSQAGDLIAQWDDDDYSAPGRLADQVPRLLASGKAATAYTRMKFTDGVRWWDAALGPINSSLVFRKSWWERHRFPEIQVASDIPFLDALVDAGEITAGPSRDLMAASVHRDNTSPRSLGPSYRPIPSSEGIPEFLIPAREECAA